METIDLSGKEEATALAEVLSALGAAAVGAKFRLTSDQDMRPLIAGVQEKHWGEFDWSLLEDGPAYLVEVHRCGDTGGGRQIREFMAFDHRRCDDLYAALEAAAGAGDAEKAKELFGQFELGMLHHFKMEEERFFLVFEEKTGMRQGPTQVMRMEHEQMRGLLSQMRQALEGGDLPGVVSGGGTLMLVIQQHNMKEEQMLYAMADMHLQAEADEMLKDMQAI